MKLRGGYNAHYFSTDVDDSRINGAFFRHDMKHTGLQGADTQVRFFVVVFFLVYLSVVEADFSLPTLVHH